MSYELTLAHGREEANSIASKLKKALNAVLVEYYTMLGGDIPKHTSMQPSLEVEVGNKRKNGWLERM